MRTLWYKTLDDANECAANWSADSKKVVRVFANDDRTRFYVEAGPSFPLRNETVLSVWSDGKRQRLQPHYIDTSHNRWLDRE